MEEILKNVEELAMRRRDIFEKDELEKKVWNDVLNSIDEQKVINTYASHDEINQKIKNVEQLIFLLTHMINP